MSTQTPDDRVAHYAGAQALRTFTHLGETFTVVRWRDDRGRHWRGYTALLHDGAMISDDIRRNSTDSWEEQMARMFRDRDKLLASIAAAKQGRMDT